MRRPGWQRRVDIGSPGRSATTSICSGATLGAARVASTKLHRASRLSRGSPEFRKQSIPNNASGFCWNSHTARAGYCTKRAYEQSNGCRLVPGPTYTASSPKVRMIEVGAWLRRAKSFSIETSLNATHSKTSARIAPRSNRRRLRNDASPSAASAQYPEAASSLPAKRRFVQRRHQHEERLRSWLRPGLSKRR
jgi:hypothetical protein